jgi:hypothetical protein
LYTNQVNAATATLKSVQNKLKTTLTGSKEWCGKLVNIAFIRNIYNEHM